MYLSFANVTQLLSFMYVLESNSVSPAALFFARIALVLRLPQTVHINVRDSMLISIFKILPSIDLDCDESIHQFAENWYLNNMESSDS